MNPRVHLLSGSALAFLGCLQATPESKPSDGEHPTTVGETGLALSSAIGANTKTDVVFMQYGMERVACTLGEEFEPLRRSARVELNTLLLPGGVPAWEHSPLDKNSEHQFADHFEVLPEGCYDVYAAPLAADGSASADCSSALTSDVGVIDGYTTEIFMINQCKGAPVGSIDAVVALNQPPQLLDLTFSPSKFIAAGTKTTVCVTVNDPNGDPVEFEWDQIGGGLCGESIVSTKKDGDNTTQCVDISPVEAGNYLFDVRIYDLLRDENNKLIRFETWLSEHGYPNSSHDSLRFPVYAGTAASGEL